MSVSTFIGCETCKERLWIGQGGYIYTGEEDTMKALNEFMQKHKSYMENSHTLVFATEYFNDYWAGYKDVTEETE